MNDEQLGFVENSNFDAGHSSDSEEGANGEALSLFSDDEDDEDDGFSFVSTIFCYVNLCKCLCSQFDLKMSMETLQCPVKSEDETKIFKETLQSLTARSPVEIQTILH